MNDKLCSDNKVINLAIVRELNEYQKLLQALSVEYKTNYANKSSAANWQWANVYKEKFHLLDIGSLNSKDSREQILYNHVLNIDKNNFSGIKDWGVTPVKYVPENNRYVYAIWHKSENLKLEEELTYAVLPFESIQNILRAYYQDDDIYSLMVQENRKIVAHSYKDEYLNSNAKNHGERIIGYSQEEFEARYNKGEIIPFLSYSQPKGILYWNTYSWIENTSWLLLTRVNLNNYLAILMILFILKILVFFFVTKKIMNLLNKKIYKNTCNVDMMLADSNKIICGNNSQDNINNLLKYTVGSMLDEQTGTLRRDIFLLKVQEKIHTTQLQSYLLFIDMDNLKLINDSLGHKYGDFVINLFNKKIRSFFHKQDILIGRFGGDEFLVYVHDLPRFEMLKLLQVINANLRGRRKGVVYSASIGIAIYPEHSQELSELMNCADQALYQAKEAGKNTYRIYLEKK